MINVKNFGAVGDGKTDDTAAIQSAFDTGLTVYIPEGRYKITGTLRLKESTKPDFVIGSGSNGEGNRGQRVYGDGKERTILEVDPEPFWDTTPVIEVCSDQIQLDNFAIRIERENQQWGAGIKFNNLEPNQGRFITIQNMYLRGLRYGIYMGEGQWCNNITDVLIEYCKYGIYSAKEGNYNNFTRVNVDSADIAFYLKVNDSTSEGAARAQTFYLNNLLNCRAELCNEYGVYIQGAGIININNCYFERNKNRDIYVDVYNGPNNRKQFTDKLNIVDCYFSGFDSAKVGALFLKGSKLTNVERNYFNCYRSWTTLITGIALNEELGGAAVVMKDNVYQEVEGIKIPANELKYVSLEEPRSRQILAREKHYDTIDMIVPNGKEKQLLFKGQDESMKSYIFYHSVANKFGCYDAVGMRSIWRTELGTTYLDFNKHLRPETTGLNIGTSSNKWSKIYATTGVIQTSDMNQKEDIKSINTHDMLNTNIDKDTLVPSDFTEFVKNTNFVTYEWKDRAVAPKGLETQVGFIAQDISKDKVGSLIATETEYSMTNLVMAMGIALQEALKEIEELKNR